MLFYELNYCCSVIVECINVMMLHTKYYSIKKYVCFEKRWRRMEEENNIFFYCCRTHTLDVLRTLQSKGSKTDKNLICDAGASKF